MAVRLLSLALDWSCVLVAGTCLNGESVRLEHEVRNIGRIKDWAGKDKPVDGFGFDELTQLELALRSWGGLSQHR